MTIKQLNILRFPVFVILVIVLSLFSCRSIDRIFVGKPLGNYTEPQLVEVIIDKEIEYESLLFRRMIIDYDDGNTSRSVRANMYIKKDSAIIISVIPFMGIEAARVMITQDQVQIIDRINREYSQASFQQLGQRFNLELNYFLLQKLLTNSLFDYTGKNTNSIKRYIGSVEDTHYVLNSHDQRSGLSTSRTDDIYQKILVLPDVYRVLSTVIQQPAQNINMSVKYDDFRSISDNQVLPYEISIMGTRGPQQAKLNITYNGVDINSSASLNFVVPTNYGKVNF